MYLSGSSLAWAPLALAPAPESLFALSPQGSKNSLTDRASKWDHLCGSEKEVLFQRGVEAAQSFGLTLQSQGGALAGPETPFKSLGEGS